MPAIQELGGHATGQERLIVSGLGERGGGGLFVLDGDRFRRVEGGSCTGIAVNDDAVAYLTWNDERPDSGSTLVIRHRGRFSTSAYIPELQEPHGLLWWGKELVAVATGRNSVLWISPEGELRRIWRAPGEGDAWHLNTVIGIAGELYCCAFGMFSRDREWAEHKTSGTGVVFDIRSRQSMFTGLDCPHSLTAFRQTWLICNSARSELLWLSSDGKHVLERKQLRGWPRGVAVTDEYVFVGESSHRFASNGDGTASVAVLSTSSLQLVDRLQLPCSEVYDLMLVNEELVKSAFGSLSETRETRRDSGSLALA